MERIIKKYGLLFLTLIFFTCFMSCKKEDDTIRIAIFNVAPTLAYSGALPPAQPTDALLPMLQVIEKGSRDTVLIYKDRIVGFIYEEGYSYSLKVQVTHLIAPPVDGHSESYKLIAILSKETGN